MPNKNTPKKPTNTAKPQKAVAEEIKEEIKVEKPIETKIVKDKPIVCSF